MRFDVRPGLADGLGICGSEANEVSHELEIARRICCAAFETLLGRKLAHSVLLYPRARRMPVMTTIKREIRLLALGLVAPQPFFFLSFLERAVSRFSSTLNPTILWIRSKGTGWSRGNLIEPFPRL